jgi:hypothetical protein
MKLEPHRVGGERSARQSRPLDRAFALLDPLLARPALVVESNDALGRAAHVRHDDADAGIKFSGIPLDLGDNGGFSRANNLRPKGPMAGRIAILLSLRLRAVSRCGWAKASSRLSNAPASHGSQWKRRSVPQVVAPAIR